MLILLNTAKTFSLDPAPSWTRPTLPAFGTEAEVLVKELAGLKVSGLAKLMKISPALAQTNHDRYCQWSRQIQMPALHAFNGDIYKALKKTPLSEGDWGFAQTTLRILSGLYGLLQPMDGIRPYRLEMKTAFGPKGNKNLYDFWRPLVTAELNRQLAESKSKALVNLTSNEYFSVVEAKKIQTPVITVAFQERDKKGLRTVALYSKQARGFMARYIIDHRLTDPVGMKGFDREGYGFDEKKSREDYYLFVRQG